jgi:hypothetical protein
MADRKNKTNKCKYPPKKSIDSNNVGNKTLSKEVRNKKLDFKKDKRVFGNITIHDISIGSGPSWKETTQSGLRRIQTSEWSYKCTEQTQEKRIQTRKTRTKVVFNNISGRTNVQNKLKTDTRSTN